MCMLSKKFTYKKLSVVDESISQFPDCNSAILLYSKMSFNVVPIQHDTKIIGQNKSSPLNKILYYKYVLYYRYMLTSVCVYN